MSRQCRLYELCNRERMAVMVRLRESWVTQELARISLAAREAGLHWPCCCSYCAGKTVNTVTSKQRIFPPVPPISGSLPTPWRPCVPWRVK